MAGLFDIFTSDAAQTAGAKATQAADQGYDASRKFIKQGTKKGVGALEQGQTAGLGYLDTATGQATGALNQAAPTWADLLSRANAGYGAYSDAVGAAGPEGQARARANFQTDPGYQFQQEQGLDALNRGAASRGMLASGNNSQDILKFSQGLADQSYGDYVSRLLPFLGQANTAAAGQSGLYSNLANIYSQAGANKSNVATGTASGVANMYGNQGTQLANAAQSKYGTIGQAGVNTALADQGASQNMWNAILGLAGTAAKAAGSYAGA